MIMFVGRFVTIIRFDVSLIPFSQPNHTYHIEPKLTSNQPVYVQHFKCNLKDIRSGYPAIHKWMRHLYWNLPAFRDTTNFLHIKNHYMRSHTQINPLSITPLGPLPNILPLDEEVAAVRK
jgi:glutathionyl-hydroquinone reductase